MSESNDLCARWAIEHDLDETEHFAESFSMKVSISVSVYNTAEYIERCVRSLYGQTLKDIEILFVDDCTPDESIDIALRVLEEYPERKNQVRVIHHEHNMGTAATKRDCLMQATGDYVLVVDSDDWIELNMVESMFSMVEKDSSVDMVVCDIAREFPNAVKKIEGAPNVVTDKGANIRDAIINREIPPHFSNKLIRRGILTENDIVWPTHSYAEDRSIMAQVAYYSKHIEYIPQMLFHYFYHTGSCVAPIQADGVVKNVVDYQNNLQIIEDFLERKGVREQYRSGIFAHKVMIKRMLLPYTDKLKYRKLWKNTYPELNRLLLYGDEEHRSTYREKLYYISISLGLYPKHHRRILSKRFRPSEDWVFAGQG